MASEIRANSITSRAGLSTVTMTDSGPMFSGITTFVDNSGFTFGVGGGTSIFTPATNILTLGTNNTEKVRIDANGNTNITGVTTAANFKTGVSNLHNAGLTLSGGQLDVGSNIKVGTAGVITATSFSGSGANLTGLPAATTINNNASTKFITGSGSANTLDCEANLSYNNSLVTFSSSSLMVDKGTNPTITAKETAGNKEVQLRANTTGGLLRTVGSYPLVLGTNQTERLRIHSNGAVSVGGAITRNYYGALNVEKTAASTSAIDIKASGTNAQAISFGDHNTISGELLVTNSSHLSLGTSSNHPLVFYTSGSANERLRILPNSQLLHTRTDNVQRYDLEFRNTGGLGNGNYGGIHWTQGATGGTNLGAIEFEYDNSGQPDFVFKTRHGGGTAMSESVRIANDGSILTANNGTLFSWPSNPGHILYSSGEYRSTSANGTHIRCNRMNDDGHVAQWYRGQTNMVGYISITSSGTSYGSGSSDERTKKNIEVWNEDVLSKFKSLTPKKFNFNWEDDSVSKHKGYIAQNEVSNFPEAYPKNNLTDCDNEYHAFTPTDMTVYLMKGLKEAAEKIETLEQDNIALRARVTNLEDN